MSNATNKTTPPGVERRNDAAALQGAKERAEEGVKERIERAGEAAKQQTRQLGGQAQERFEHARNEVGAKMRNTRGSLERFYHDHPLVVGAGLLIAGIVLGLALPRTQREGRLMGQASQSFKETVKTQVEKVGAVARETFEQAKETAKRELDDAELDAEGLKARASEMAEQAKHVAETAASEARETAKKEAKDKGLMNESE